MTPSHEQPAADAPLTWTVTCGIPALGQLAGIPLDALFRDASAIVEAWRTGAPRARERFGPDIQVFPPGWAHLSYGHANALGCPLRFPPDSEAGCSPIYATLEEGIAALETEVDFARRGLFPFYLELWETIRRAFPGRPVPFAGLEAEGPVTTAWLLRGHGFFLDLYDDRPRARQFLALVTDSIVRYKKLLARINGQLPDDAAEAHIADDVAAMIPPALWPELVVPSLERYYRGMGARRRLLHLENLAPDHLPFLRTLRIDLFDPSVSPKLTPALVRDRGRVPFLWRLSAMQIRDLPEALIEPWVERAAADGAAGLFAHIERATCTEAGARRVRTFIRCARAMEERSRRPAGRDPAAPA